MTVVGKFSGSCCGTLFHGDLRIVPEYPLLSFLNVASSAADYWVAVKELSLSYHNGYML